MRCVIGLMVFAAALLAEDTGPSLVKDVLPIFHENCSGCHATTVTMGSLDLGTYEGIMRGGNNGRIVVPGRSEESRLFLMASGKMKPIMPMDGKLLAAGDLETIRKWIDAGAKAPAKDEAVVVKASAKIPSIAPRVAVKAFIYSLALRQDGAMAVGGYREVRLMDRNGKVMEKLGGHVDAVRAVAFSGDGKLLATGGGVPTQKGEIKSWDVATGRVVVAFEGHVDAIYAIAFSPNGKLLATASYDKLIQLWDVATGKPVKTLKDHIDAVYALLFTPDGQRLISGAGDRTIKVWDVASGTRIFTMSEPTDGINAIAIDPQGKRIAAAGQDKSIRIWTLGEKAATLTHTVIAHEDAILRIGWSPDGKRIASTSADKVVKVFVAEDLKELASYPGQSDWVNGLAFSADSTRLVAARFDGSVQVYWSSGGGYVCKDEGGREQLCH